MEFLRGLFGKNKSGLEQGVQTESPAEPKSHEMIDLIPFSRGDQSGFMDRTGQIVIRPQFKHVQFFSEGLAAVWIGEKIGFIDKNGSVVIEPQFDETFGSFREGLALVRTIDKWKFIDKTGAAVIEGELEKACPFREGLARIKIGKTWGYINQQGAIAINPEYYDVKDFSEGLAAVCNGDKWGFIDTAGRVVISLKYDGASYFSEGLAVVDIAIGPPPITRGFIDRKGKVVSGGWSAASPFTESLAYVSRHHSLSRWGYITRDGKYAFSREFAVATNFSEGLAAVKPDLRWDSKWGFINKTGEMVIEAKFDYIGVLGFDDVQGFVSGLASVKIGDRYTYIDKTGRHVRLQDPE
jgi:hypothetical protein